VGIGSELSAANHVAANRGLPLFLLIHVADHTDTTAQAYRLWAALDQPAFAPIWKEPKEGVTSNSIAAGDLATKALFEFTDQLLREPRQ
jgi:arylformamidase